MDCEFSGLLPLLFRPTRRMLIQVGSDSPMQVGHNCMLGPHDDWDSDNGSLGIIRVPLQVGSRPVPQDRNYFKLRNLSSICAY